MDRKYINEKPEKHTTPKSELNNYLRGRISHGISNDSPFRNLPSYSTPPSRFARIVNPFEPHLIERLHLPVFSPTVFVQNSTPKTEQKFKWTIEDISSLRPADIDETTVSQHVCTVDDPHIESVVQQKIETFFSEKEIVPSPMHIKIDNNVPLVKDCSSSVEETPPKAPVKDTCEGGTQTLLSLPPVLPKELEEALMPYFTSGENQQKFDEESMKNSSLYKQLFSFENTGPNSAESRDDVQSLVSSPLSSPAISSGLSPIQFSPCSRGLGSPFDMPELKDCNLSPISKNSPTSRLSRSACGLDFSAEKMSIDVSMIVPDTDNHQMSRGSLEADNDGMSPLRPTNEANNSDGAANWSMEYKHVSISSPTSSTNSSKMDVSNSNTPHIKIFTGKGQRKRLSESFKNEECEDNINSFEYEEQFPKNRTKIYRNDLTDVGYYTQEAGDFSNNCTNVFASTPSKRAAKIES